MAWTDDLLAGLADYLADDGTAFTWDPTGTYQPAAPTPLVIGQLPIGPDQVVALSPYPVDDATGDLNDTVLGVQFRVRGTKDPRTVLAVTDAVFDRLHSARRLVLGGVHVVQIWHVSGADLGTDSNNRHERTENYYVQATRPSAHRPD
jgi:hypothetical protein